MQPGHTTRVKIESKRCQSPNVTGHSGATSPAPLVEGDEPEDSRGTSVVNQSRSESSSDKLGTLTSVLEQLGNRADEMSVDRDRQSGASVANHRQGEGKSSCEEVAYQGATQHTNEQGESRLDCIVRALRRTLGHSTTVQLRNLKTLQLATIDNSMLWTPQLTLAHHFSNTV